MMWNFKQISAQVEMQELLTEQINFIDIYFFIIHFNS